MLLFPFLFYVKCVPRTLQLPSSFFLGGRDISQALFGEGGGDLVGQCGQLRGIRHVYAARRGDVAETAGGGVPGWVGRLVHDLCSVVRLGFCVLPERQFVGLNPFPKLVVQVYLAPQVGGVVNLAPRAGGVEECWGTRLGKGSLLACLHSLSLSFWSLRQVYE